MWALKKKRCLLPDDLSPMRLPDTRKSDEALAQLTRAVAHPVRVRIVRILQARQACICGELVDHFPLAQSTISQHLKILKDAGLIMGEIDGPTVCYCLHPEGMERLKELIAEL